MNEYHPPHLPYEWGETYTTRHPILPRTKHHDSPEYKAAQDHYEAVESHRISHPNVTAMMGGVVNNDVIDNMSSASRRNIRQIADRGIFNQLPLHDVQAVNDKLYRDEKERVLTDEAIEQVKEHIGAVGVELAKKERGKRQLANLSADQDYLSDRRDKLSRYGDLDSKDDDQGAWDDTIDAFVNAERPDGMKNIDILHEAALQEDAARTSSKE